MSALQEQFDEERAMLLEKLAEQRQEISQIHANETNALQAQLALSQQTVKDLQEENERQFKELNAALLASVEPLNAELETLRKDHESFLLLQKEYQELQARIEPFRVNKLFTTVLKDLLVMYKKWTCLEIATCKNVDLNISLFSLPCTLFK